MEPVKAAKLYRIARRELGPDLARLGFKEMPDTTVASWYRPEGERWLVMAFQPDKWNVLSTGGYRFKIAFCLSRSRRLWGDGPFEEFTRLLSPEAREELRGLENATIAHLPPPGPDAILDDWEPISEPYPKQDFVWFRQAGEADLIALMQFIRQNLGSAIKIFLKAASSLVSSSDIRRR